jgi:UDP-N-acetylglucosamine--N-acetylmuramyl-(pentapeptide) pyrophosphoryl-undecaprenol N-acetylglucosamine transferase
MSSASLQAFRVAIACGGTGGHLFPGLAVAQELKKRRCSVTLLVSTKEVDQTALEGLTGFEVLALPAVGLSGRRLLCFAGGFCRAYSAASKEFRSRPPQAVLAMGGFTSGAPVLAARRLGAQTFLHDSNTIPGRANRWLSWVVQQAFVAFPGAVGHLHTRRVTVTGTPVRPEFVPVDPVPCRAALGLDPSRPVVLTMGGSQGASGLNRLVLQTLLLASRLGPELQWLHLTGTAEFTTVSQTYRELGLHAAVFPFLRDMSLALGAASVAVSRAGGSSLAELAAMRLPAILVPFPNATDDHQWHNAEAFREAGAARLLAQKDATSEALAGLVLELVRDQAVRASMRSALGQWHRPQAAEQIAQNIVDRMSSPSSARAFARNSAFDTLKDRPNSDRAHSWLLPETSIARSPHPPNSTEAVL